MTETIINIWLVGVLTIITSAIYTKSLVYKVFDCIDILSDGHGVAVELGTDFHHFASVGRVGQGVVVAYLGQLPYQVCLVDIKVVLFTNLFEGLYAYGVSSCHLVPRDWLFKMQIYISFY